MRICLFYRTGLILHTHAHVLRNRKPVYKCFRNRACVQNLLVFDTTPPLEAPLLVSGKALIAQLELSAPLRVAAQFQEASLANLRFYQWAHFP